MTDVNGKKSVKKWVILLVLPFVMLVLVALLQLLVRFALVSTTNDAGASVDASTSTSLIKVVANIFALLVGVVSVILIMLSPLWIILLVRDLNANKQQTP